jgi:porin
MTRFPVGAASRAISSSRSWVVLAVALAVCTPLVVTAQPYDVPPTWGGDLWSRPRLTGDWFGFRDEMGKRGVVVDIDMLQILQGNATGGQDTGVSYGGTAEYTLHVDTGKLGLWPGGFFRVYGMSGFGKSENEDVGATMGAVNMAATLPEPHTSTALMDLTYMQFFTTWLGVFAGKVYGLDADNNDFAHNYRTQFLNMGLNINLAAALAPISAWGGGLVVVPWKDALMTVSVLDPDGTPVDNSLAGAFSSGVLVGAEGRVTIRPFGLAGHQLVGGYWSNKERLRIDQDPSNIALFLAESRFPRLNDPGPILRRILERFFPQLLVPVQPAKTQNYTWTVYYNFDQYLWNPGSDKNRGLGVFFRFGASDGQVNPVKYAYNVGFSGNGVVPGRADDTFGVGWSRIQFSNNLVPFLRDTLHLGLDHEDAVELYYNIAATKWLGVTVDLQIVDPGLKKTLTSSGELKDVNTAVVGGLRAYVRF